MTTGVAGPRCPRVARTLPLPIQVIGRPPRWRSVQTVSPATSSSTLTSPCGVRIRVPGRKHIVTSVPDGPVVKPKLLIEVVKFRTTSDDAPMSSTPVLPLSVEMDEAVKPVRSIVSPSPKPLNVVPDRSAPVPLTDQSDPGSNCTVPKLVNETPKPAMVP